MVTDFQKRLREIREAKDREVRARQAEDLATAHDRFAAIEHRFDRREKIVKVVEEHADNFAAEVEAFSRSKSFFEGMYQLEVSGDEILLDEAGTLVKRFSRITFLLDPKPAGVSGVPDCDGESVLVRCKKVVRNRDLESASHLVESPDESLDDFRRFVEEQFLEFADAYFSGSKRYTPIS